MTGSIIIRPCTATLDGRNVSSVSETESETLVFLVFLKLQRSLHMGCVSCVSEAQSRKHCVSCVSGRPVVCFSHLGSKHRKTQSVFGSVRNTEKHRAKTQWYKESYIYIYN